MTDMADDDEDVVFGNSALCAHLKDVGYNEEDFAAEHHTLTDTDKLLKESVQKNTKTSFYDFAVKGIKNLFGVNNVKEKKRLQEKDNSVAITDKLLKSGALVPEDADFIYNFILYITDEDNEQETAYRSSIWRSRLSKATILAAAYLANKLYSNETSIPPCNPSLWDGVALTALSCFALPWIVERILIHKHRRKLEKRSQDILSLITSARDLKKLHKKSVRLIQEMELIARGFTLVGSKTPVSRLEEQSGSVSERQCMGLRQLVFRASRQVMMDSRQATVRLMKSYPLEGELENTSGCIATLPLEQYGVKMTSDDELAQETDNYALSALKTLVELCNLHVSEFLRRLVLVLLLSQENKEKDMEHQKDVAVLEVVTEFKEKIDSSFVRLKQCYTLHQCVLLDAPEREKKYEFQTSQVGSVYVAVHSLSLHLQAALTKIRTLEEKLDQDSGEGQVEQTALTSDLQQVLSRDLKIIQAELTACNDCCEEAVNRTEKTIPKRNVTQEDGVASQINKAENAPSEPMPIFDTKEPLLDDQVFEAYTDPTELDKEDFGDDAIPSLEERDRKRAQKQEAKHVLNELKSIITVRDKMWQEREEKARKRMAGEDEAGRTTLEEQCVQMPVTLQSIPSEYKQDSERTNKAAEADMLEGEKESGNNIECEENSEQTKEAVSEPNVRKLFGSGDTVSQDSVSAQNAAVFNTNAQSVLSEESRESDLTNGNPNVSESNQSSQAVNKSLPTIDDIKVKLGNQNQALSFNFTKNVAAMAAAHSHNMPSLSVETFGDSDDSEEEGVYGD